MSVEAKAKDLAGIRAALEPAVDERQQWFARHPHARKLTSVPDFALVSASLFGGNDFHKIPIPPVRFGFAKEYKGISEIYVIVTMAKRSTSDRHKCTFEGEMSHEDAEKLGCYRGIKGHFIPRNQHGTIEFSPRE